MVKNSKILVAGGTGFIGANLINQLISEGYNVVSLSKNCQRVQRKIKGAEYVFLDLNKPFKKNKYELLKDTDYVVNCSGYVDHRNFSNGGQEIFNDHFGSLLTLVNLAIDLKVKAFIHLGSSDEYGKNRSPIKESTKESPLSPYALAKLTSTHYLNQCFTQGILNTIVIRPFIVFGEMQSTNRFLPYLIDNCLKDQEFKVTKGDQLRDYLYVKDFNRAIIKSFNNIKAYGEVINIASGKPISIKEVINDVKAIIGKGKPIFGGIEYRSGESMELYANVEKAKKILNWVPKYEFKKSLKEVINWYAKNG